MDIWNQVTYKVHIDGLLIICHIWVNQCVSSVGIHESLQEVDWGLCTISPTFNKFVVGLAVTWITLIRILLKLLSASLPSAELESQAGMVLEKAASTSYWILVTSAVLFWTPNVILFLCSKQHLKELLDALPRRMVSEKYSLKKRNRT